LLEGRQTVLDTVTAEAHSSEDLVGLRSVEFEKDFAEEGGELLLNYLVDLFILEALQEHGRDLHSV
jgi:hypothetical protein